jgi:CTP:molybdopterin cytidylyltransferase MocA
MAWATEAEVLSITGVTVTAAQLAQANSVITIFANRTEEATLSVRDLYWLKQATCWQAAWQKDQAGYTTRHAVTEVTQDGMQLVYTNADTPDLASVTLAPLAQRALKNTSWKGSRTVRVTPVPQDSLSVNTNYRLESNDNLFPWQPI